MGFFDNPKQWIKNNPGQGIGTLFGPIGAGLGWAYDEFIGDPKRESQKSMDKYLEDMMAYAQDQGARSEEIRTEAGEMPKYEIPESMKNVISTIEGLNNMPVITEMPGQQTLENKLLSDTASRVSAIKEMSTGSGADIGAVNQAGVENSNRLQDIFIESARIAQENELHRNQVANQNKMTLAGAYGQMAGYEDQAYQMNELMPWQTKMNRADNLEFGGDANYWNAYGNQVGVQNQRTMNAEDRLFQLLGLGVQGAGMIATGGISGAV